VVQPDETARLKKIIGDQGNTIGELRKLMGTLTERLVNNPPQAASQSGASVNLFKSRDPNDYPTAAEVQQALLLAGGELYQAINQKLEEVAMQSQLSQAGVSPEESNLIRLEYPSLAHLPATERNAVIAAIVKVKRTEANQAQAAFATMYHSHNPQHRCHSLALLLTSMPSGISRIPGRWRNNSVSWESSGSMTSGDVAR
jgi:hypothetical protein